MPAVTKNLLIEQGATFTFSIHWLTPDGLGGTMPRNLTGWTFRMQARKNQQSAALIDATNANGRIIIGSDPINGGAIDLSNGWVTVKFSDEDTDLFVASSSKYDLEAQDPQGNVYRLLQGSVAVSSNITQAVSDPVVT